MKNNSMDYQKCVEEIEQWALDCINCPHTLCSLRESIHEEMYGGIVLAIINKHKNKNIK